MHMSFSFYRWDMLLGNWCVDVILFFCSLRSVLAWAVSGRLRPCWPRSCSRSGYQRLRQAWPVHWMWLWAPLQPTLLASESIRVIALSGLLSSVWQGVLCAVLDWCVSCDELKRIQIWWRTCRVLFTLLQAFFRTPRCLFVLSLPCKSHIRWHNLCLVHCWWRRQMLLHLFYFPRRLRCSVTGQRHIIHACLCYYLLHAFV